MSEIRLFVDAPLVADVPPVLDREQAHYLLAVMRRRAGETVLLFNGRDGEWRARIAAAGKRTVELELQGQIRRQRDEPGPVLWFAPLKRARQELLLEKATELGVACLRPVLMRRSVVEKVNLKRQQRILIEAAEQCGRLTVPALEPPVGLDALVRAAAEGSPILWADEATASTSEGEPTLTSTRSSPPEGKRDQPGAAGKPDSRFAISATSSVHEGTSSKLLEHPDKLLFLTRGEREGETEQPGRARPIHLVQALHDRPEADLLIGPEGGFDPAERALLSAAPEIVRTSLGPRILRAETAALAALAVWQASRG